MKTTLSRFSAFFLLSGSALAQAPSYSWHLGYGGIPLCEYYLRTGDAAALPIIQKWVDSAVARERDLAQRRDGAVA